MNSNRITLLEALLPLVVLIFLIIMNILYLPHDTLDGANQLALIVSAAVAIIIGLFRNVKWSKIQEGIINTISSSLQAILILMMIGALAGSWLISGVVPLLIHYGLEILHPKIFYIATLLIASLVSLATGSSWSTVATIGVALLGIGTSLGFQKEIIAGAIISGAYFGDKMSPLSDTTNLAPAMAGTDIFTHIRYMMITTIPSYTLTAIIFIFLGVFSHPQTIGFSVDEIQKCLENTFNLSPFLLLVPILLIIMIVKKMPPLPAIFIGSIMGIIAAIIFQPHLLHLNNSENSFKSAFITLTRSLYGDFSVNTGISFLDELFQTSGMKGMLDTIWLIITAMIFGGAMEATGLLQRITQEIMKIAKKTASLVAATALTSITINITASDQYLSIVIPGRMYKDLYSKKGFKPQLLSRTLEDAGTVTSVLVPWNTCGATQARVLGVSTFHYAPYAFFNIISPIMTVFIAAIGYKIEKNKQ